jgi:hypothetical protein
MNYSHLPRSSSATQKGYRSASSHWDKFLISKGVHDTNSWNPMEQQMKDLLNQFATYLVTVAKKPDGDYYSAGSVLQFLSGTKETFQKKYPQWEIWINHSGRNQSGGYGWYDEIRSAINKAVVTRVFGSGETIIEMSSPIGRTLLKRVINSLLQFEDIDSLESCSILAYNFVTVGRAGEAALSSWKSASYSEDACNVVLYCPMSKVMSAKRISLYNDAESFQLDPYFNLAIYWMVGGGRRHMTVEG